VQEDCFRDDPHNNVREDEVSVFRVSCVLEETSSCGHKDKNFRDKFDSRSE